MATIECELPDHNPPSDEIKNILLKCRKIAVVNTSPKASRDSNKVARYLMEQGFEIMPVNPGQRTILGKPCFKTLRNIPGRIDMADLFLSPARIPHVVDQAIDLGIRVIWMQVGVVHNQAAEKARNAGIQVVMNMCTMAEHKNLSKMHNR